MAEVMAKTRIFNHSQGMKKMMEMMVESQEKESAVILTRRGIPRPAL
jgi:hypothetical protein